MQNFKKFTSPVTGTEFMTYFHKLTETSAKEKKDESYQSLIVSTLQNEMQNVKKYQTERAHLVSVTL